MNTLSTIECTFSEYLATLEWLKREGRRAVNIVTTRTGYRLHVVAMHPHQAELETLLHAPNVLAADWERKGGAALGNLHLPNNRR